MSFTFYYAALSEEIPDIFSHGFRDHPVYDFPVAGVALHENVDVFWRIADREPIDFVVKVELRLTLAEAEHCAHRLAGLPTGDFLVPAAIVNERARIVKVLPAADVINDTTIERDHRNLAEFASLVTLVRGEAQ